MKEFSNKVHFGNADFTSLKSSLWKEIKSIHFFSKKKRKEKNNKKWRKIYCFSMHLSCLNEFKRNKIFLKKSFYCFCFKEVLFALSDYAWDDKRPSFTLPSLMYKIIQLLPLLSLMIFFLNLDQWSPSTLGADIERNYVKNYEHSNLERNAYVKR